MSKAFRQKILDEIDVLREARNTVEKHFQVGKLYIRKYYLTEVLKENLKIVTGPYKSKETHEFEGKDIEKYYWDDLCKHLLTCKPRGRSAADWDVYKGNDEIVVSFRPRTLKSGGKSKGNVQQSVNRRFGKEIAQFLTKKKNIISRGLVFEHGIVRNVEQFDDPSGMLKTTGSAGLPLSVPSTNPTLSPKEMKAHAKRVRTKRTQGDTEYSIVPGAKGDIVDQKIHLAIDNAAKHFMTAKYYTEFMHVLQGWFKEMFGYDTDLRQNFKSKGFSAHLVVKAVLTPEVKGANPADQSAWIRSEFETLMKSKAAFKGLAKRMNRLTDAEIDALWSDSPGPITKAKAISAKEVIDNLFPHKANPNMRLKVNKKLYSEAKEFKKTTRTKANTKPGSVQRGIIANSAIKKVRRARATPATGRGQGMTSQSPIALRNLLNEALPQMVASKMVSPALQFRTGRFANSARVENVNIGPRGGVGIDYTYMRDPYETFEPGNKQGSTQRDPRKIIGASIRELATGILGRQPTTIRRN